MASSKKASNGRSPLVNPQRQITAFFNKKPESSSSPSPALFPILSKQSPNPNATPTPITPSSSQSKQKKPVLVIAPNLVSPSTESPISGKKLCGPEVVGRRIRIYWPLDKTWYEGCVKSFDELSGKHLVMYDDGEEESLNLLEEKIEWIEEPAKKKLRRLRKISVADDEEVDDHKELEDNSDDEDWEKKVGNEILEDEDSEDMDLELEEEEHGKGGVRKNMNPRKRKLGKRELTLSTTSKKSRTCGELKKSVSTGFVSGSAEKLAETTQRISGVSK